MAVYDLYGTSLTDINSLKASLEVALEIEFESHESDYQGPYFQWGQTAGEHLVLKRNEDPLDGEPAEVRFPDSPILIYVNDTLRSEYFFELIKGVQHFVLLRHEDLE
ncbi:hypothetical protein VL04_04600 [Chromobacterium violaceum]|nr:hypothetical protein VK93_15750 [Chromobacterium violaceum]KMN85681.1 hypothetical protein VL02_13870 [Chromobacterium violaceum]KMN91586.1 hypothetical protein VL04_04600 [Chromobacterium violaceum]KMO05770.1 hypothetical protein VL16_01315 [Chromobacterium violaceum]